MHTLRLLFILLSLASVNLSRPLDVAPVMEAIPRHPNRPDIPLPVDLRADHQANLQTIVEARLSANRMLNKMNHVIQNPALPRNSAIIQASFGPRHEHQMIAGTIRRMREVTMRTRVHPLVPSRSPADTRFIGRPGNLVPDSVVLGPSFFGLTPAAGGGTLIREAARYTTGAGVHVLQHDDSRECRVLPEGEAPPRGPKWKYRTPAVLQDDLNHPMQTPAECAMDDHWSDLTQHSGNMHDCADAYRVFGNLCNYAIHRRDVHILKRALLEGDKQASHLISRSDAASCPPQRINKNTVPNTT